jgi:hypothetical protein
MTAAIVADIIYDAPSFFAPFLLLGGSVLSIVGALYVRGRSRR